MNAYQKNIVHIIIAVLLIVAGFAGGWYSAKKVVKPKAESTLRIDTIIRIDTFRHNTPTPVYVSTPVYVPVHDTIMRDSVVYLPILQKEYRGEDYRAWVSGYNATLDSIVTYPKTITITKYKENRRWGLGVVGGYGAGKQGLTPFIGIGLYYRIF